MSKTRWKTDEIVAAAKIAVPDMAVVYAGPGGDVDTDEVRVTFPNGCLRIRGFVVDGYLKDNRSDVDVDMVELSAGEDSRGGLNGVRDTERVLAYGKLHAMLVERGFDVVPCLGDYF